MKIIQNYADSNFLNSVEIINQRFLLSVYPISPDVVKAIGSKLYPGKTVVLFSGSWQLDFDAIYIDASFFKNNTVSSNEKTYFVDVDPNILNDDKVFDKIMYDTAASNILILHSGSFCNYRSVDALVNRMKNYQRFNSRQIILSVPHIRVHFNRLKYSATDIAQQYQTEIVDDSFVITLTNTDINSP